jgi:zinc protease
MHEEPDQKGVAHFIEHLAFRGTVGYTRNSIYSLLSMLGASLGADFNATTYMTHTTFDLICPDDNGEACCYGSHLTGLVGLDCVRLTDLLIYLWID